MKLTSMTQFVLEQSKAQFEDSGDESHIHNEWSNYMAIKLDRIEGYANFLQQPLTLGMFVPCDLDGNVIELEYHIDQYNQGFKDKYQQAKERVLFEGFEVGEYNGEDCGFEYVDNVNFQCRLYIRDFGKEWQPTDNQITTIEHLIRLNITLTKSVQKQITI